MFILVAGCLIVLLALVVWRWNSKRTTVQSRVVWMCICGTTNEDQFCPNCGRRNPDAPTEKRYWPGSEPQRGWLLPFALLLLIGIAAVSYALFGGANKTEQVTAVAPVAGISKPSPVAESSSGSAATGAAQFPEISKELSNKTQADSQPNGPFLSDSDRRELMERRKGDQEIINAADAVLNATSGLGRIQAYCRFMVNSAQELLQRDSPAPSESVLNTRLGYCKAAITMGAETMPDSDFFIEKRDKAARDLSEVEAKLGIDPVVPKVVEPVPAKREAPSYPTIPAAPAPLRPSAPAPQATAGIPNSEPSSGVLCHGPVRIQHNESLTFENLPAGRLHFIFDSQAWQLTIRRQPDRRQTVTLRSNRPGDQAVCDVRWEFAE